MRVIDISHRVISIRPNILIIQNEGKFPESLEIVEFPKSIPFNQKMYRMEQSFLIRNFQKKIYILQSCPEILENACAVPFVTGSIQKFKPESSRLMEGAHTFSFTQMG